MSAKPHFVPASGSFREPFEKRPCIAGCLERSTAVASPTVLLVGRNGALGPSLLKSFVKHGTEFCVAPPDEATPEFAKKGGYGLILLDSTVSAEQRKRLATGLAGSQASLFYAFPVEYDCWWLPVLSYGRNCHGAPAFRRNEFAAELERLLHEQTAV